MKLRNRALAVLLSMIMVLTFMPAMAFAEGGTLPVRDGSGRLRLNEAESDTDVTVTSWYDWEIDDYYIDEGECAWLIFNNDGYNHEPYNAGSHEATSSNEEVARIESVTEDIVRWKPVGTGTAEITFTNDYGDSITVPVSVKITHPAEIFIWVPNPGYTGGEDEEEEIRAYELTFDEEYDEYGDIILRKWVNTYGKFVDQIHEERETEIRFLI